MEQCFLRLRAAFRYWSDRQNEVDWSARRCSPIFASRRTDKTEPIL